MRRKIVDVALTSGTVERVYKALERSQHIGRLRITWVVVHIHSVESPRTYDLLENTCHRVAAVDATAPIAYGHRHVRKIRQIPLSSTLLAELD